MKQNKNEERKCIRCEQVWDGHSKGWKFHGRLTYCPVHKCFQFSLCDRD